MTSYEVKLLQAALQYSGEHFELRPATDDIVQSRVLKELSQTTQINVFWTMTTAERERRFRPIRIPIDKGLLGWRLLLVKQPSLTKANVESVRSLRMVQGHDWPDTEILKAAGFKVDTSADFKSLFAMVEKGRVDAMPRSVVEIDKELANIAANLVIEPGIMLYYPAAEYFFVAQNDDELFNALEKGLKRIIANGIFDDIFNQEFGAILERLQQQQNYILKLNNPLLPVTTPLNHTELWQPLPSNVSIQQN